MNPEAIFRGLCDAPALEEAVKALNEPTLSRMILWLREEVQGGVRRLVLGVCEAVAVERYVKACPP